VKLAILASKPVGTKVCIYNNVLSFQVPGPFQAFCRIVYKLNKTDLHFMYNPIQLACSHFLSAAAVKSRPRMRILFQYAQRGLERLMETYRTNSTVRHSLNYYHAIIANYVDAIYNPNLFKKDSMSAMYSEEAVASLNAQWTEKWITAILDVIGFLSDTSISSDNIRVLESLMLSIDKQTNDILLRVGLSCCGDDISMTPVAREK
jgi:hypothetical protein